MKTIRNVFFTTITMIGLSAAAQAGWSWHTGWSGSNCNTTTEKQTDSEHYSAWGDRCYTRDTQRSRHTRTSRGNWCDTTRDNEHTNSHNWGNWCGHGKGSKGSHDKGSKCNYKKGIVKGIVFEDTNDNGRYDSCSDKKLQNVIVNITDSEGTVHQVNTNCSGIFFARNIAEGNAIIDINASSLPSGASISIGNDPDTITVNAYTMPTIHYYGYSLGEPTGNVFGQVFEDMNGNGQIDDAENGIAGISVSLLDANGETHTAVTDSVGKYTFSNIIEGSATITIDPASLPTNAELTVGDNPTEIEIVANEDNDAGIGGYTITVCTGAVTGSIINDINKNGQVDSGETGIEGIKVIITDANGEEHTVVTDTNGNYTVEDLPVGTATVAIDRSTLPENAELTIGEDPNDVEVKAGDTIDAGIDGYVIQPTTGELHGSVFEDSNYNGQKDSNEKGISGIDVVITDAEGNEHTVTTDSNGNYTLTDLPEGTATVDVDESTLPENSRLTVGEDPNTVEVVIGESVDAGTDGYSVTALHGTIYSDDNENGVQDDGETGVENIHLIVTDSNGNEYDVYTDSVGDYTLSNIPHGDTQIEIDEESLPSGNVITSGRNPKDINLEAYKNTDAGSNGYSAPQK